MSADCEVMAAIDFVGSNNSPRALRVPSSGKGGAMAKKKATKKAAKGGKAK